MAHSNARTMERPRPQEPDIGRCFEKIGHSCRSERTFHAVSGRFIWRCEADHCPMQQSERPVFEAPAPMRVQGGGSMYRPPARKRG